MQKQLIAILMSISLKPPIFVFFKQKNTENTIKYELLTQTYVIN